MLSKFTSECLTEQKHKPNYGCHKGISKGDKHSLFDLQSDVGLFPPQAKNFIRHPSRGWGRGRGTLIFSYKGGMAHFFLWGGGGGFKILNSITFWGFQIMNIFWGMEIF